MPEVPANPGLNYVGVTLLLFGFFLILTGSRIIKVEKISVTPGAKTWGTGLIIALIGVLFLYPEIRQNLFSTPTATTTPEGLPDTTAPIPSPTHTQTSTSFSPISTDTPAPIPLPPTNTPTPLPPTDAPASDNLILEQNVSYSLSPDRWFPLLEGLSAGNINEITNETASWGDSGQLKMLQEMGRITSYERFYSHQAGCNSSDLKGIYIQIFFFYSSDGSNGFFDWANAGADVKFINTVGDNAYVFSQKKIEDGCMVDEVSTTFQRYNVVARARVKGIEGKMAYADLEDFSVDIVHFIDQQLMSNAE